MMFKGVPKFLFLFLLSILLVCFYGVGSSPDGQLFSPSYREVPNFHLKETQHDSIDPPTKSFSTIPTTNPTTKSAMDLPDNPTSALVTIPSTDPVTATPNPASTTPVTNPVATPSTNPVATNPAPPGGGVPSTTPETPNPPSTPIMNPVTTPSTNPVTTNPAPPGGGVPATTPVTNPETPPATTSPPTVQGQTWCVAKTGAQDTALQQALDYACGHAADCSSIQKGGNCYNPNTLQNHASYAFNSFYQKNPSPLSCDFGKTATITNSNPSTGSCMFTSSSSSGSATPPTPGTTTPTPPKSPPSPTTSPTSPTQATSPPGPVISQPGTSVTGSGNPTFLNMTNPDSGTPIVFGNTPPISSSNNSISMSKNLRPFISCIILATIIKIELILDVLTQF